MFWNLICDLTLNCWKLSCLAQILNTITTAHKTKHYPQISCVHFSFFVFFPQRTKLLEIFKCFYLGGLSKIYHVECHSVTQQEVGKAKQLSSLFFAQLFTLVIRELGKKCKQIFPLFFALFLMISHHTSPTIDVNWNSPPDTDVDIVLV